MAQISSYPTIIPQLGDRVLGSNNVDASGAAVIGNPTVQYSLTDIKNVVDQNFVEQIASLNTATSQGPGTTNTAYKIRFGTPEGVDQTRNVQLLQGTGTVTSGDKIVFNSIGTYRIALEYMVGVTNSGNLPFLLFRTLKDGAEFGNTTSYYPGYSNVGSQNKEQLLIDLMIQITSTSTVFEFEMLRDSGGADDGSLYTILNNQATWSNTPNASITILKLI
jgi:hypothetical protein|tara:strand:+ start:373 stop:1032 length:660 start_codon:yes stop_codon:yes gene_type:complete